MGWGDEYAELTAADARGALDASGLERLALAAHLTGQEPRSLEILTRAHHLFLDEGDVPRAVRCAFWLGFSLGFRGDRAQAGGWLARATRLLDDRHLDCVERGYLKLPLGIQRISEHEVAAAEQLFAEADDIGSRFGDRDLVSLARQGRGRALIGLGETERGVAMLDEVMVTVTEGELSPAVAGMVYCSVISACFDRFDVRRAQEWTEAANRWGAAQPDLVAYRGECLVHRAAIMQLHGGWSDALDEARRAREVLGGSGQPAAGAAHYQVAELHRLRGEFDEAAAAYQAASECGRLPYPGLALLRLAQGRVDLARAAIGRVLDEVHDPRRRPVLLAAAVEIFIASSDVESARRAADELAVMARPVDTPFLVGLAAHATGAVLLAEGDSRAAMPRLRDALAIWREIGAPYETARTTELVALACRRLDDADGCRMEREAARRAFLQLGAKADVERLDAPAEPGPRPALGLLTGREVEVLRLVASGRTNRAIADELSISEKTVARHISNIFTKLDLSSRSAATAYAFQHGLVSEDANRT